MRGRGDEAGVVLVNVLVTLAIGAAAVALMLGAQERAVGQAGAAAGTARAEALALGAETSLRLALMEDMRTAPDEDHPNEAWAALAQEPVELETGRFAVAVADARGRFDVNRLALRRPADIALLQRLCAVLGLPPGTAGAIARHRARSGPAPEGAPLRGANLPEDALAALGPHVDAQAVPGPINLNAATPAVMAALFAQPGAASRLLRRREAEGRLTPADLDALRLRPPPGAGFASDLFDLEVRAEANGMEVVLRSRLMRADVEGVPVLRTVRRRFGAAAPPPG